jgi:hypothetical protein
MYAFQYWLYRTLGSVELFDPFMNSKWGWPICESLHFLGLSMLIGTVGCFDLRLLGLAKRVPLAAMHRLIPWGVAGYILNICTGFLFLVTAPDQYIYNPSFHLKVLLMGLAGLNVAAFYSTMFRRVRRLEPGLEAPFAARVMGGASLLLWTGVIVFGRLLTFYRPAYCPEGPTGLLSTCLK